MERVEEHGQEEIDHQDGDKGAHKCLRGGTPHPFRASLTVKTSMATNQGESGLQRVMVNGAVAGDAGGAPPLPVPSSTAAIDCNTVNTNTIQWIYLLKDAK